MLWKQITLIGVGLLGGSIGLAARQNRLAKRVVGFVRREASLAECRKLDVADEVTMDLEAAVKGADFIIFCTPLLQMRALARTIASQAQPGTLATDVGSTKAKIVNDLEKVFRPHAIEFVGSHPMAGSEKMGPSAATASLFKKAVCIVTPTRRSNPQAVDKVGEFWQALGARVLQLSPKAHDEMVARSSHLPHIMASLLAKMVLDPQHPKEQPLLCATGFRDTTRVASGSPEMWKDILLENRACISAGLDAIAKDLKRIKKLVGEGNAEELLRHFQTAKARRDAWMAACASPSSE